MMRIGIVCYPTYGGSGVVATELGIALADKGCEVHFISYKRPVRLGPYHPRTFYHEVSSFEYPLFDFKPYDSALTSKIVDVALHYKLEILHVHYAIPHATIAFLAREILKTKGIYLPIVTTLHGTDITLVGTESSFHPTVEFGINQSDGVTAVSQSLKSDTLESFHIINPIEVIPNFIDFNRFYMKDCKNLRRQFVSDDQKILMHISNFRKVKRVVDIVRMFAIVSASIDSKLVLVGDGPERTAVTELGRELGVENRLVFLGKQEAIEDLLSMADVFVVASEKESFGLAALEAMACGVPVVSSDAGGLQEVIRDGYSGFICPTGDFEMMAEKSIELLRDQQKLALFRKQAIAQAHEFDLLKILPKYIQHYEKVIGARSTSV
jgi:N-acetyl-alpha-D-glucosaminyl L-malate synthase BshA